MSFAVVDECACKRHLTSTPFVGYPTSLNATCLQRVADVMQQYGIVEERVDVKPLLFSGTTSG
jgi:hypothetical protein